MKNGISIPDYASGYGVLNDFSSELYRDTMRACRPIVSGERIIRHTRAGVTVRSIDKILNLPYDEQDELLDFLTEMVTDRKEKDEEWDKFMKSIIDKIMSKQKFKAHFDSLGNYFKKLNSTQKIQILSLSINKLNCGMESIRREINNRLWNNNAHVQELMIIDQIIYFFQNVINSVPLGKKLNLSEMEKINTKMGFVIYLILRLEAYRRLKIDLDDLNNDLSLSRNFKPGEKYIKPSEYDSAFEIFGG